MRVRLSLKQALKQSLLPLAFMVATPAVLAGGGGDLVPAPYHEEILNQISMREAEMLLSQPGVIFYDVNTLEIWGMASFPAPSTSTSITGRHCCRKTRTPPWCFTVPTASAPPAMWLPER